jgi:hypothetical protein
LTTGRHPRLELQGGLQEKPLERSPAFIVVRGLARGGVHPAHRLHAPTVDGDGRPENGAIAGELAVVRRLLEEHAETVAGLQIRVEIHLAAEDVRQLHRELDPLPRRIDRRNQRGMRRVDARVNRHHRRRLVVGQHLGVEHARRRAVGVDDAQEPIGVDLILELAQQPVDGAHETVGLIGAQPARIEDAARGRNRPGHEVVLQPLRAQQAVERRMGRNRRLDGLGFVRKIHVGARRAPRRLGLRARRHKEGSGGDE